MFYRWALAVVMVLGLGGGDASAQTIVPMPSSLVVDFGPSYGLWIRRGTDDWRQLNPNTAKGLLTIHEHTRDLLLINFGPGVGLWLWGNDGGSDYWILLNTGSPTEMVTLSEHGDGYTDYVALSFPGYGVWTYGVGNGQWTDKQHPSYWWAQEDSRDAFHLAAADLAGLGTEDLIADFPGQGLWVVFGPYRFVLDYRDASAMVGIDMDGDGSSEPVVSFPGAGVVSFRSTRGMPVLNPRDATRLAAGDLDGDGVQDLILDFGPAVGVWALVNNTSWWQLTSLTSEGISTGDLDGNGHDEVIVDFGEAGLWSWEELGGWNLVHTFNPKVIATGRFFELTP